MARVYSTEILPPEHKLDISPPVRVGDFGSVFMMSGALYQGRGRSVLLLYPTADDVTEVEIHSISEKEWFSVLKQTDDPVYFERDETGTTKAVHRKQKRAIGGAVQQQIWARDGYRCMYCGCHMGSCQLTVDHFVPLELGGASLRSNYISCCRQCNKRKADRHPGEYCEVSGLDYYGLQGYLSGTMPDYLIEHLR